MPGDVNTTYDENTKTLLFLRGVCLCVRFLIATVVTDR